MTNFFAVSWAFGRGARRPHAPIGTPLPCRARFLTAPSLAFMLHKMHLDKATENFRGVIELLNLFPVFFKLKSIMLLSFDL